MEKQNLTVSCNYDVKQINEVLKNKTETVWTEEIKFYF